jgi:alpha-glucosidase
MKKISLWFVIAFIAFLPVNVISQTVIEGTKTQVQSPDGNNTFNFYQKQLAEGKKQMYYTVTYKQEPVVLESELGILIENQLFESALGIDGAGCKIVS